VSSLNQCRHVHLQSAWRLPQFVRTSSPSQFPPRPLMMHSAYPKASSRHFELCLRLGYGACMRLGLRGIGATPSLAHRQPLGALVLPTIISPIELVYARERCVPSMSHPPCLWLSYHVYSRAGAPPSATVLSATASDFVYPLSLELAWPPSWRSCSVAQGSGQLASDGLTCGRKSLDSINMMACKCRATLYY
jgi:hypothetical protein